MSTACLPGAEEPKVVTFRAQRPESVGAASTCTSTAARRSRSAKEFRWGS